MTNHFRMDKTAFKMVTLETQGNDFQYWQAQSVWNRLAALESIRREYHQWKYGTEPRLQRVLTITQRT